MSFWQENYAFIKVIINNKRQVFIDDNINSGCVRQQKWEDGGGDGQVW